MDKAMVVEMDGARMRVRQRSWTRRGVLGLGHIQGRVWKWIPQGLSIPMGEETEDRLPGELEPSGGGSHLVGQGLFTWGVQSMLYREEADFAEWGGAVGLC